MATSNHKVSIVVGVKDLASSALKGIQNTVNSMNSGFGKAGTYMGAFNRNLDSVIGKMDRLANSMYKFNMYTSALQRNLKNITMVGGLVAGGIAVQGANQALEYDYNTRKMQSRMGVNSNGRKEVSNYILNTLANQVSYTPNQLAEMGVTLGQGGISSAKDMKAMLKTTSYFSEAVDAVPDQAAEMVIAAAKGFGISMENSGQITDKLAVALNKSLLHTEELPHAIGELAGRAKMYGQSLDSSMTALMTMRDQGISAAQGSQDLLHAMRQASRIGNDDVLFKTMRGYFADMGITDGIFNKKTRKLKEFPDLIGDVEKAMLNKGFTNPKYNIKTDADYQKFLAKNNGVAPSDFWDSMKAMPLIQKVFGAAGMAPILAGLQSKYEEVDADGNKTGKVYYGSKALKRTYEDVKNSDGEVNKTHAIMAKSGKFQLEVLQGAWQGAQIKMMDGLVPLIAEGAKQLTKAFGGGDKKPVRKPGQPLNMEEFEPYANPYDQVRKAIKKTAKNYRKEGHNGMATTIDTVGNSVVNTAEITQKTFPPLFKQIGSAFNKDIVKADWGSNLIEFPWHIVKNGIKFISDIVKSNKEFDAAIKTLPENLQDPAKLVGNLVKGGIALMVTGAVVKVIELGIRGVSLAMKGGKIATSLTESILKMFTGGKGAGKGVGGAIEKAFGKNMAIKANIVNVYGGVVNGKGGKGTPPTPGGGAGGTTVATAEREAAQAAGKKGVMGTIVKWGKGALKYGGPTILAADIISGATGGPSFTKDALQSKYNPLNPNTDRKINEMHSIIKQPHLVGPKETKLVPESNFWKPKWVEGHTGSPATTGTLSSGKSNQEIVSAIDRLGAQFPKNTAHNVTKEEAVAQYNNYAKALQNNGTQIMSSITQGFGTANQILQNIKVNNVNNINVNVPPPSVVVKGIPNPTVQANGSKAYSRQTQQNALNEMSRGAIIQQRRLGW